MRAPLGERILIIMIRKRSVIVARPARAVGRPRSEAARRAILDAAFHVVRERGYEAAAMEEVAERAGVAKTTVYRHWATKEALVVEALGQFMRARPVPDTGSTRDDLRLLMTSVVRMYEDPSTASLLASLLSAMTRSPAIAEAVRSGFVGIRRDALRTVLEQGVRRGELRRGASVELAIDTLGGMPLYRALVLGKPPTVGAVHQLVDAVLRGLAP